MKNLKNIDDVFHQQKNFYNKPLSWCGFCTLYILLCGLFGKGVTRPYCCKNDAYVFSAMRIGVSAVEWIIILGYGIGDINDNNYLFGKEHGLLFFVAPKNELLKA